jgi:hypothetical protein
VADLAPIKERLAKCIRLFGSAERANARTMTERALESIGASWTDLGDWIEHSYSEAELCELVDTVRKQERTRAPQSNGHIVLPVSCCRSLLRWQTIAMRAVVDWT